MNSSLNFDPRLINLACPVKGCFFCKGNHARCRREIKSRIFMAKAVFNKKKKVHFTFKFVLNLRMKPIQCYVWNIAWYGAEK
jgi:hypothetical protein